MIETPQVVISLLAEVDAQGFHFAVEVGAFEADDFFNPSFPAMKPPVWMGHPVHGLHSRSTLPRWRHISRRTAAAANVRGPSTMPAIPNSTMPPRIDSNIVTEC